MSRKKTWLDDMYSMVDNSSGKVTKDMLNRVEDSMKVKNHEVPVDSIEFKRYKRSI
ncbi:MAG: hypothetical protein FWC15_03710 [Fibromonadales bacterium]|nr:hypothetical protein [Fibromonadales bacterium]